MLFQEGLDHVTYFILLWPTIAYACSKSVSETHSLNSVDTSTLGHF